jgi:hypothetical protein
LVGREWEEPGMSLEPGRGREMFPSSVDPEYDCVPIGSQTPEGRVAAPPDDDEREAEPLCPEGYVPQRRRRKYSLEGKVVVTGTEPKRNPAGDDEVTGRQARGR